MSTIGFEPWPKIARLNRGMVITEKIDGTNAAVVIVTVPFGGGTFPDYSRIAIVVNDDERDKTGFPEFEYHVYAQSRNKFITPGKSTDNYGFAGWVQANAETLATTLGEGRHFGEWWGSGIQSSYGLTGGDKRFSLFNTSRWLGVDLSAATGLGVVPVLATGNFNSDTIAMQVERLRMFGSEAAPGFMKPEGIVVYLSAARSSFKVTLEGDAAPKGAAGHALDFEQVAA